MVRRSRRWWTMLFGFQSQRSYTTSGRTLCRLASRVVEVTGWSSGVRTAWAGRTTQMSIATCWSSKPWHAVHSSSVSIHHTATLYAQHESIESARHARAGNGKQEVPVWYLVPYLSLSSLPLAPFPFSLTSLPLPFPSLCIRSLSREVPPQNSARRSGERCELLQRVWAKPGRQTDRFWCILVHFVS